MAFLECTAYTFTSMRRYIAFLRGINVGGHKIIKMVDLAKIFASMEFTNVRTFIQSGNVFFCSDETDESVLLALIETTLSKKMGYDVQVMIRRIDYLEKSVRPRHSNVMSHFYREHPIKNLPMRLLP
jgi:uncharacterized protein (DUF1697 family)